MFIGNRLGLLAVAGAFVLALAACGGDDVGTPTATATSPTPTPTAPPGDAGPGVTTKEIRLGMTNDVSGVGMTPYAAVNQAVQAYFAYVNAEEAGVCGRTLTLNVQDDEYSGDLALELTKIMTTRSPVLAMIGALNTQAHQPVAAYLNDPNGDGNHDDGIPDLFVSTGWSGWGNTETYPWTIGFIPDYRSDAKVIAEYIKKESPDAKIGLLFSDDEFGQDYRDGLREYFNEEQMLAQQYPPDDEDVSDEMGAVLNFGPQIIVIAAPPGTTASAIKIARSSEGEESPQFVVSFVNQPSNLASDLGGGTSAEQIIDGFKLADGVILTSYLLSAVEDENTPAVVEHKRIMETYDGSTPSSLSIYGQALAETVVETLDRACPDLTRENVLKAAESLDDFHPSLLLPDIDVSLSGTDHESIQAMQVWQINADGTLKELGNPIDVGP